MNDLDNKNDKEYIRDANNSESCHCHSLRTKHREGAELRALINRLNRIEGQVRGVREMVEGSAYCVDIINQVSAISSALASFSRELLENHIRTCVVEDIKSDRSDAADELVSVVSKFIK